MNPSPDQAIFRETTEKFLRANVPPDEIRRLRDDPAGFDREYWRRGADLGWTSLLVSEAHGGGAISGAGLEDLTLVAHEFGRHAAPGPLTTTNVVAATLSASGNQSQADFLRAILSGTSIASWCTASLHVPGHRGNNGLAGNTRLRRLGVEIRVKDAEVTVTGVAQPVESAEQADLFLVTGQSEEGVTQVLVPADTPGLSVSPMRTVDLTRRFGVVTFDAARIPRNMVVGKAGKADDDVEHQLDIAVTVLNAEAVGAMQAAFDMTVEWAFDRYSFGRPLASYQALKHRFADMLTWLEASHAIADAAAGAVEARAPDAGELVSVAKAFIGDYGAELLQECVQLHGGIGVTFEHDVHLFLRRFTVNRTLAGTPADHRQHLATMLDQQEGSP